MESVGGIFKEKKFVNRGFLIGPYCPVYGCGVILITILLQKYSNDIPALFFLSTLLCGTLEYATSYLMEKLFNARWWDYSKRKFNINGRICLETLLPFGIAGSAILCIVNPFLVNYISLLSISVLSFISYGLLIIFILDVIVSFVIINSFKNATYVFGDNTEEVSNKVKEATEEIADEIKDATEDFIMKASSDIIVLSRRMKVRGLKFERKVSRYTSEKLSKQLEYKPSEFVERLKENRKLLLDKLQKEKEDFDSKIKMKKENIENRIKDTKELVDAKLKEGKENINNRAQTIKMSSEEFTKQIKEKIKKKSIFHRRLLEAFPNLKANMKFKKNKK